jgi:hypothetical protein
MNIRWWIYDEYSLFDPILDPNKFKPTLYYRPPPNCDLDLFIPYLPTSYIKWMGRVSRVATLKQQLAQQTAQITQPPNMTPTPSTPPTPPPLPQNPLFPERQRTPSLDPDNVPVTKSHLRELYSQDERKSIPVYKGKRGDQLINNWLKDNERLAQSAGWGVKDKIKHFSDRLRGDAADWHSDYIDHAADKVDYDALEKALIRR